MDEKLKISIITICFNSEKYIEKTIQSVIEQTYSNIEYIIIDGGSIDNTLSIINKYRNHIDTVISEKDNGIYDAMNKGIQFATGDYIYFLNSGDYFFNNIVCKKVANAISKNKESTVIYGDIILYDNRTENYTSQYNLNNIKFLAYGIYHQSIFVTRDIFKKYGYFDTKYSIYADFEWLSRVILRYHEKKIYIPIPIAYYLKGGKSELEGKKFIFEKCEIISRYGSRDEIVKCLIHHPIFCINYILYMFKYKLQHFYKI